MQNSKELKLNYKRTLIIGFAFFSILMVWQAYNFYCPLYLKTLLNDILVTKDIERKAKVLDIVVLDHIIIGKGYYSFSERHII